MIREVIESDLAELLNLYLYLHEKDVPPFDEKLKKAWEQILSDPNHHIIVAEENGHLVSSCVCVIIPNLTRNVRPYAFVENVVTDEHYRSRGLATQCLNYAKEIALKENCYKLMLLTGSKNESTLCFYEQAGYNRNDKTAFIQWV